MKTWDQWINAKIEHEDRAYRHWQLLDARRNNAIICIEWQSEAMPTRSFHYFHAECLLQRPEFKSEAIANGAWREVKVEDVGSDAKCAHCERNLREKNDRPD